MPVYFIEANDDCVSCGICESVCPVTGAVWQGDPKYCFDADKCICCRECEDCCPVDCIYIEGDPDPNDNFGDPYSIVHQDDLVDAINNWMGTNFNVNGGSRTAHGSTDCSGLVWGVYRDMGLNYDYCSTGYFDSNPHWVEVTSPENGDAVVWAGYHSGIYYVFNNYNIFYASASQNQCCWGSIINLIPSCGGMQPKYYRYVP